MNQVAGGQFPRRLPVNRTLGQTASSFGQEHSRRLCEIERPSAKRYIQPDALTRIARRTGNVWESHSILGPLTH